MLRSPARRPKPEGRKTIAQRFIAGAQGKRQNQSRQGRKNTLGWTLAFFRPRRGLASFRAWAPTVETAGYCRLSLRDYLAWRAAPSSPASPGTGSQQRSCTAAHGGQEGAVGIRWRIRPPRRASVPTRHLWRTSSHDSVAWARAPMNSGSRAGCPCYGRRAGTLALRRPRRLPPYAGCPDQDMPTQA